MSDLVRRMENVKKEIELTKSKTIALKANAEKEEEILRELIKEIKELGFNPKTLKEDIASMEKDLELQLKEKEEEVIKVKEILDNIERNLRSNETI